MIKINKKERKQYEEARDLHETDEQFSEEYLEKDMEMARNPSVSSEIYPTDDMYKYKKLRIIPESQAEYEGLIDKDVVLSNIKAVKPNAEELCFLVETIDVFKKVFSVERELPIRDSEGRVVYETDENNEKVMLVKRQMVFDTQFEAILSMLQASYKFKIVSARAMGDRDREAVLDREVGIRKEIGRKREENKKGMFGTGTG